MDCACTSIHHIFAIISDPVFNDINTASHALATPLQTIALHDNNFPADRVPPSISHDIEKVQANFAIFCIECPTDPLRHPVNTVPTLPMNIVAPPPGFTSKVVSNTLNTNATLEQDKQTLLKLWRAFGKSNYELTRGSFGNNKDLDDVSKWRGIVVEGER